MRHRKAPASMWGLLARKTRRAARQGLLQASESSSWDENAIEME